MAKKGSYGGNTGKSSVSGSSKGGLTEVRIAPGGVTSNSVGKTHNGSQTTRVNPGSPVFVGFNNSKIGV